MTETAPRYHGTTLILRAGDPLSPGATVTADPASALADAMRQSTVIGATDRSPHVYEVTGRDGALVVVAEILVSRQMARRAADLI